MEKTFKNIDEVIKHHLANNEVDKTAKLIEELKNVKKRGYLTKDEFIKIGMWKSPRSKKHYLKNSEKDIELVTKKSFSSNSEKEKIEILIKLHGVKIPTASAILMLIDPQNYGVIDIRVWQTLYLYNEANTKPDGKNFNSDDWVTYLTKIRLFAKNFNVTARNIEKALFDYHKNEQAGNLYKERKSHIDPIIKKLVLKQFGKDNDLYKLAKEYFINEEFVSTGSLQRILKISYIRAAYILDRMIEEGFCDKQSGAKPCKVLANKN